MSVFYNKEGVVILEIGSGKIKLKNSSKYSIGDSVDGGIVVYTYGNPLDGFKAIIARQIATPQAALLPWAGYIATGIYYGTGATGTTIGSGLDNTLRIVKKDPTRPIVASEALEYDPSGNPTWYLPSKDELGVIYNNKNLFENATYFTYWSSSESTNNPDEVWVRRFEDGVQWENSKSGINCYYLYFQIKTILG